METNRCPACGAAHEPDAFYCPSCGDLLVRECPACAAPNPLLARQCVTCGQRLEILDALFSRVALTNTDWLRERRQEAPSVKAEEETASQARIAEMWAIEARRREALAQARAERDRQQRIIVSVAVGVVALAIVAVLVTLALVTRDIPTL